MFGRWLGNRKNRANSAGVLSALPIPSRGGLLSCRVLDPVNEPVRNAEFVVSDAQGLKLVGGGADPFGSFIATVPAGEYRLAVSADGYTPYRGSVTITDQGHTALGDLTLQVAQPPALPEPGSGRSSRCTPRSASPPATLDWPVSMAGSTTSPVRSE